MAKAKKDMFPAMIAFAAALYLFILVLDLLQNEPIFLTFFICSIGFVSLWLLCCGYYSSMNPRNWISSGFRVSPISLENAILYDPSVGAYDLEIQKIKKWCNKNCKGRYRVEAVSILFSSEQDAATFKLFWP